MGRRKRISGTDLQLNYSEETAMISGGKKVILVKLRREII